MSQGPTVLVAFDASPAARRALTWAGAYVRRCNGKVVVVQVVEPGLLTPRDPRVPDDLREDQRCAIERALCGEIEGLAREDGIDHPEVELVPSNATAEAILDAAQRHNASLVCMGTRGQGALTRLVLGSVADRVLRRSEVPVVLSPA
jgi:nucleotide-binding universal stress UspA family protein